MLQSTPLLLARACVLCLVFVHSSAAVSFGADWPQFRGPGGQGIADAENLPVTWGEKKNLRWKLALPGPGASSPIVLGDKIYLTCYSGYGTYPDKFGALDELALHVVCVVAETGKIVWDKKLAPERGESKRVRDHGYAAPTPATDGKHLYVFFGKSGVFKFDLAGEKIWRTSVGSGTHGWGCGTSPILHQNLVIVNASVESGSLVALEKTTGKEVWRAGGMKRTWNTPHLVTLKDGKTELAVSVRGSIYGFDPVSGKQLWTCYGIQDYVCPSIVSKDGVVYAIGGRSSRAIAVRAGGRGDVTESHRLWETQAGANVSSPVIHGDHLYWVSDRNRTAYCVRLGDGEVILKRRFPAKPYASALLADGKVFIVTRHGGTFVLAATPELEQLGHNEFDDGSTFNASPVAVDDQLLLRSDKYLYCIGKKS